MILVAGGSGLIGSAICEKYPDSLVYDLTPPKFGKRVDWMTGMFEYDAFIDCARYEKSEDQLSVWASAIRNFKQRHGGRMILFSSIYGHKAPDFSIYPMTEIPETPLEYSITKGGIEQATRFLAQKLKPECIQVNCIAPGGVFYQHSREFLTKYRQAGGAHMITTENILPVVEMLLHPDNAVNGQVITVDGGWSL